MAVQPTGPISLPLANLRSALAHCDGWRDWVGGSSGRAAVDKAADRIYLIEPTRPDDGHTYTDAELIQLRPFAVVGLYHPDSPHTGVFDPVRIAKGTYRFTDHLLLEFEANVADEDADSPRDLMLKFMNDVGLAIESMLELSQQGGFLTNAEIAAGLGELQIKRCSVWDVPQRADAKAEETQGDYCRCSFLIEVGV